SHVNEHSGAMRMQALVVTFGSLALVVMLEFARVFDAPWQARALAIAVALVEKLDLPWDTFRRRLMDEIATDPQRPYYESWSAAGIHGRRPGSDHARRARRCRADRAGAAVSHRLWAATSTIRGPATSSVMRYVIVGQSISPPSPLRRDNVARYSADAALRTITSELSTSLWSKPSARKPSTWLCITAAASPSVISVTTPSSLVTIIGTPKWPSNEVMSPS